MRFTAFLKIRLNPQTTEVQKIQHVYVPWHPQRQIGPMCECGWLRLRRASPICKSVYPVLEIMDTGIYLPYLGFIRFVGKPHNMIRRELVVMSSNLGRTKSFQNSAVQIQCLNTTMYISTKKQLTTWEGSFVSLASESNLFDQKFSSINPQLALPLIQNSI